MERFEKNSIVLKTLDGKTLAAALYKPKMEDKAALAGGLVFIHMMPATKESWESVAISFAEKGYLCLAFDLRGHGESEGGPKAYAKFSDEEHQKSILDLDAAAKFLLGQGLIADKIIFVGASIGANLSLKYIADNSEFKTAVLFSAGLNYRGVMTESAAVALSAGQRVFVISARDDGENAAEAKAIFEVIPAGVEKRLEIFETGGHGTDILANQPKSLRMLEEFTSP